MTRRQLLDYINSGEGLNVEFKQRFSTYKKIAKEMIAFANTRGGVILFGIDDDSTIKGVASEKGEAELIKKSAEEFCEPPLNYELSFIDIDDKEVVAVWIHESLIKPIRLQDFKSNLDLRTARVYVRVNDKSVLASKEMIKLLQVQTQEKKLENYKIGKIEKSAFEFLDENENISVKQLSRAANISYRRASRTLINLVRANLLVIHTKDNGDSFFTSAV